MRIEQNYSLEQHNTFHLPAKTRWFMEYETEEELEKILHDEYFQECLSTHIGSGSNLLFINDYNGIILHSTIKGINVVSEDDDHVIIRVGAAELWDDVVAFAVSKGWFGIENLSLIPGETGAAAVQNIGAYGVEIKDVIESVEAWNQLTFEKVCFSVSDCDYSYRNSRFKNLHLDPHIITYVNIRLSKKESFSLDYGQLKEKFSDAQPTLQTVRDAVIAIRREKLPDPSELGNAGDPVWNLPKFQDGGGFSVLVLYHVVEPSVDFCDKTDALPGKGGGHISDVIIDNRKICFIQRSENDLSVIRKTPLVIVDIHHMSVIADIIVILARGFYNAASGFIRAICVYKTGTKGFPQNFLGHLIHHLADGNIPFGMTDFKIMFLRIEGDPYNTVFAQTDQIRGILVQLLNDLRGLISYAAFLREDPSLEDSETLDKGISFFLLLTVAGLKGNHPAEERVVAQGHENTDPVGVGESMLPL